MNKTLHIGLTFLLTACTSNSDYIRQNKWKWVMGILLATGCRLMDRVIIEFKQIPCTDRIQQLLLF